MDWSGVQPGRWLGKWGLRPLDLVSSSAMYHHDATFGGTSHVAVGQNWVVFYVHRPRSRIVTQNGTLVNGNMD